MRFDQLGYHSTVPPVMPRPAQEPSRPLTRSMVAARRSLRLRTSREGHRSSLSPAGRNPPKKRKRPLVLLEAARISTSRKECRQIKIQPEPRIVDHRQSGTSGGSSPPTAKSATCSHPSPTTMVELEEQLDLARQAQQDLAAQVEQHNINLAQSSLKHLEEYFTCPLCFEILACPYALTPRKCGHTFCATCILKWFFSRLHKGCGGWHEAVDCPLCRSPLPHTPERTPRSASTFPFTPNRTADVAIRGFINAISHALNSASTIAPSPLSDWYKDGHSKQEWSKRERAGRTEMASIAAQWDTLKPTDFVNIKNRLEV